jgi:GNAT superfamily N-acetyltransferase
MADSEIVIRTLTEMEVDTVIEWAVVEGWDPGACDKAAFLAMDEGAFLGGFLEDKLVACISLVIYDDTFAFLGFFIVAPEHRGRGFGFAKVWRAALARAGEKRVIGLDGVVAQQGNYSRSAFTLAHRNIRFGGLVPECLSDFTDKLSLLDCPHAPHLPTEIVKFDPTNQAMQHDIIQYDSRFFPAPRAAFTRTWLTTPGHLVWAALRKNCLVGYIVIRPCIGTTRGARCKPGTGTETHRGCFKIGPLFADDARAGMSRFGAR